jgi:kumamolisin
MAQSFQLPNSAHAFPERARDVGAVASGDPISVTVYLRPNPYVTPPFDVAEEATKPLSERRYLSASDAAEIYGAASADIEAVTEFAAANGLDVVRVNPAARSVKMTGSAAAMQQAFGVRLRQVSDGGTTYRSHQDPVTVPAQLGPVIQAVFGLDTRQLGQKHLRLATADLSATLQAQASAAKQPANTYLPPEVAALYDFPSQAATGQTVAVLAFNGAIPTGSGGYQSSVLAQYFTSTLKLPVPHITDVVVQGPGNDPGNGTDPNDSTTEVYLDLSMVGSLASGADIVIYFTEFTEQGWVDALSEAITDTTNDPAVISISYGNPEEGDGTAWTAAAIQQVNTSFESAAARGISITCASGDQGASDGESSGVHVDFPASSPWVLGCGGTRVESSGTAITSEVVWNDQSTNPQQDHGATGGGVSVVFPLPGWQTSAGVPPVAGGQATGRGVPDVSSLADPETPFVIPQPDGSLGGVGGTSAAAPLWAALLARCNAAVGKRLGFLNPSLYAMPAGSLRDVTRGDNMRPGGPGYQAGPGWDACTGLGSPGGSSLLAAIQAAR